MNKRKGNVDLAAESQKIALKAAIGSWTGNCPLSMRLCILVMIHNALSPNTKVTQKSWEFLALRKQDTKSG